jgi:hypothetical protein
VNFPSTLLVEASAWSTLVLTSFKERILIGERGAHLAIRGGGDVRGAPAVRKA